MRKTLLDTAMCLALVMLAHGTPIHSQTPSPNSEIKSVEAGRVIGVRVEVRAKDSPLVIAVCGSNVETDDHPLCGLAWRLQVRAGNGWRPVSVRKGIGAVLGGVAKDSWMPLHIAPGEAQFVVVAIDPDFLDVRRGDRLRVEVDSWSSEAAMRTSDPEKRLTSPSFECP
jgi:hypothetical protein